MSFRDHVGSLLCDDGARDCLVRGLRLSPPNREIARSIMEVHSVRAKAASDAQLRRARVRSFLKPLRDRHVAQGPVLQLDVPVFTGARSTFHKWLSGNPESDRLRDIRNSKRILQGLAR